MDRQIANLLLQTHLPQPGLSLGIRNRNGDIAKQHGVLRRKGKNVGRFAKVAKPLIEILHLLITLYYHLASAIHFESVYVPPHQSLELFAQAMRAIGEPIHGRTAAEISMADLLGQLFAYTDVFDMETRPELILLQKTMVQVEGVARAIDPAHNIWQAAKPVVDRWSRREFGPEGLRKLALTTAREALSRLRRLPETLEKLDAALNRAAEPPPAPVVVKRTTGWAWLLTGFAIAGASAAGLWFMFANQP